jgi:creatinine amidohydrolase
MLWHELNRTALREVLPDALVVVPVGAIEQHGPYLPTWTDSLIVETVVRRAAGSSVLVTPTLSVGASDHHLPFGGTLSLSAQTMMAVLVDVAQSVARCGGRRMALVNGHGGNRGVCAAAAATAAAHYDVTVSCTDYWSLWRPDGEVPPWPGHAGRFETALVRAIRPDLVGEIPPREKVPAVRETAGWNVHSAQVWRDIDGYTDDPSMATESEGRDWLAALIAALATRLEDL